MTEKTNDDINASLALSKEWQRGVIDSVDVWFLPQIGSTSHAKEGPQPDPPDFCGDWKFAGPELVGLIAKFGARQAWEKVMEQLITILAASKEGDKIQIEEAIARAAEAMIEEEA